MTESKILKH